MISEKVRLRRDWLKFPEWLDERDENDPVLAPLFRHIFADACWPKVGWYLKRFSNHLREKHAINNGPVWDALHEAHRRYRLARDAATEPAA